MVNRGSRGKNLKSSSEMASQASRIQISLGGPHSTRESTRQLSENAKETRGIRCSFLCIAIRVARVAFHPGAIQGKEGIKFCSVA